MSGDWPTYIASLAIAGVASGFASGLFGVGGGIVRIPIFLYLFPAFGVASSVVVHLSAGTSLALAVPSSLAAARAQRRAGHVDVGFLRSWLPALGVGVVIGLAASRVLPARPMQAIFAVAVLVAGLEMLFLREDFRIRDGLSRVGRAVTAALLGAVSVVLGLTGGAFVTPILTAVGQPIHRAIAVSSVGGVLISAVGTVGFVLNGLGVPDRPGHVLGFVDGIAFMVMAPIVLVTAPLGVRVANRLDKRRLKKLFGAFLLLVAIDLARAVLAT